VSVIFSSLGLCHLHLETEEQMAEVFPSRQERQRPADGQPSTNHPNNTCTESDMNLLYECGMLDSSPAK